MDNLNNQNNLPKEEVGNEEIKKEAEENISKDVSANQENSVSEPSKSYEERMIEAFVQKPEKFFWYKKAFSKFNINGMDKMAWVWSWWAFFTGGFWFLLYRKAYLAAFVALILNIVFGFIPIVGPIIFYILAGGFSTYFIYKKYKKLKMEIEYTIQDEEKRIEAMMHLGGYNSWVVWVNIAFAVIVILGIIAASVLPHLYSGNY